MEQCDPVQSCVSNVCQLLRKKGVREWVSWMCVWHHVSKCVCVCLVDCSSTQSSDIPPDSSELFTVPGLSGSEEERKREVRWEGGGENHVRRQGRSEEFRVRQRVFLSVSGDGVRACMFWRSKVPACSPIITWWCVMKVRPVCGVKPYQRFHTADQADTVLVRGLKHHPGAYTAPFLRVSHLQRVLHRYDNHPDFQLLPLIPLNLNLFPICC